jgi:hypothetical protein
VPSKSAATIAAGWTHRRGTHWRGVESSWRDVSKRRRVLLGEGAQVGAHLLDEMHDRRDPSPGARAIGAEMASATESASADRARERRRCEARRARRRDAHPPRRLIQMVAKLVALSPLPRLSRPLPARGPTLTTSIGGARGGVLYYVQRCPETSPCSL